jgi:predicted glycoside hydrolase/deacetylase ChbG (UPF0249 family)
MKLILNADDFGYSPTVNQTIIELHQRGRLSSASLITNLPHSQSAMTLAAGVPDLGTGVHLNLTKGRPYLPAEDIPTLVGRKGQFHASLEFFHRAIGGRVSLVEAKAELDAQINTALAAGIKPTHLDSHSHWQILPGFFNLVQDLAEQYGISGTRQSALRQTLIPNRLWLAAVSPQPNPGTEPRYMFSLHQWLKGPDKPRPQFLGPRLRQLLSQPGVTAELVIHPGKVTDPDFPPDTVGVIRRQWEYEFVLSPKFDDWLSTIGAEIVNYGQINAH